MNMEEKFAKHKEIVLGLNELYLVNGKNIESNVDLMICHIRSSSYISR